MADILLVSVRKDAPRADALAARFARAGLSIGKLASDADLRSSAAAVLLLSQDTNGTLAFGDVALRVVRAGKGVIADLADVPRPAFFGDARVFDLSRWRGDPFDHLLDPLETALQQMLVRELRSQAETWRTISDRRDAWVFQDYLARYGPNSAFAPLAQLRLERLTARAQPYLIARATAPVDASATPGSTEPRAPVHVKSRSRASSTAYAKPRPRSLRRRAALATVARSAMMVLPFLVCAALTGTVAFGGVGEIRQALGPAQALAAPLELAPYLDNPAAPAAAAPWRELLSFTQSPAAPSGTSPLDLAAAEPVPAPPARNPSQITASLALPAPPSAPPLEPAAQLEPVVFVESDLESTAVHGENVSESPPSDDLDASAALMAGDDPAAAMDQTAAPRILYGPPL